VVQAFALFMVAHSRLTKAIEAAMAESGGLTLDLYDVLVTLEDAPGQKLRFNELADRIVLSPSGLTRRIDRLVRLGYVKREACETDRRSGYAVLTDEGRQARERAWPTLQAVIDRTFRSRMSEGEARQLGAVMRRIVEGLEQGPATRSEETP
jgi:DNA-binding MarR family transcriptional regulator